uniref:START domain-containing protein n=1 Tax=Periophthalmus magnuspinnatus TaxID=409849 RepID=A0A3B4ARA7_9GOBI
MEVGVRAEAYQEEGPNRHINSAFMIFEVLDTDGKPRLLPRIRPEPEGRRRFEEAIARKKIRLDRKYIISRQQAEVPLSVPWDPTNQVTPHTSYTYPVKLRFCRVSLFSPVVRQVRLFTVEHPSMLSFRVESEVDVPAPRAFSLLSELSTRHLWDPHYKECELIRRVDADNSLYRVVTPPVRAGAVGSSTSPPGGEGVLQDFILLASKRKPCASGDPYVIALRSVTLPTHPPTQGLTRGEVLCAGFTILDTPHDKVSYYNQASAELLLPYISTDMAGLSSSFYHTFCSCRQYLTHHRLSTPQDLSLQRAVSSESQSSESDTERLTAAVIRTQL